MGVESTFDDLRYEGDTGGIYWIKSGGRRKLDKPAGTLKSSGYIQIKVNNKVYLAHRLAWFLHYGEWPEGEIDHVNRDKADNRIENLRVCTRSENGHNREAKGFYKPMDKERFRAAIKHSGKLHHIGYYDTEEEARAAYLKRKKEYLP